MKPMQNPIQRSGAVLAAAGLALALTLSGCGGGTDDEKKSDEAAQTQDSDAGGMQGEAASTESPAPAPTESEEAEPSESATHKDPFADSPKTTSWASDEGIKIDKDGEGKVSARSLEADVVDLFENKFDIKVKEINCKAMDLHGWFGISNCQVDTKKRKYFGSVSVVDHKDSMVKYELKFPGLKKDDIDLDD